MEKERSSEVIFHDPRRRHHGAEAAFFGVASGIPARIFASTSLTDFPEPEADPAANPEMYALEAEVPLTRYDSFPK